MPTASDGKEFPYTPEGIKAHKKYEASLNRKNKSMGKDKNQAVASAGGLYATDRLTQILGKKVLNPVLGMFNK